MLADAIPGMGKIMESEPAEGSIILVTGGPGTLKSSFIFSAMSNCMRKNPGRYGVYVTLEESRESHLRNMDSLGIRHPENLRIFDIASFRADTDYETMSAYIHPKEYLDLVLRGIKGLLRGSASPAAGPSSIPPAPATRRDPAHEAPRPCCYGLDSLNALQDLARVVDNAHRQKTYELFTAIRAHGVTSLIIYESLPDASSFEHYLADGIIEMGLHKGPTGVRRYLKVRKMKGVRHSLEPFLIDVARDGGLAIINPLA